MLPEKLDFSRPDQAFYLDSGLPNTLPFSLDSFPDNIPHCQMDTLSECLRKLTSKESICEIKPLSGTCIYLLIKDLLNCNQSACFLSVELPNTVANIICFNF